MQLRESNEIFKKLMQVKKRIDKERAELIKELAKLEKEQRSEKPNGKAFSIDAIFNGTHTAEEISRQIVGIKAALALPYYADSEYRRLSILYLEAVTAAEAEDLETNERKVEAAVKAIEEAKEHLEQLRKQREDIVIAASDNVASVGLANVSADMMDYSPAYILNKYKDLCGKYD